MIEVRDFDVIILHHNKANNLPKLQQSFQIAHRTFWVERPSKLIYEPSLTMRMADPEIEFDEADNYNGVFICLCGKASFTIENNGAPIKSKDMYACVHELAKKMHQFTIENSEKFEVPEIPVHPEYSELYLEVDRLFEMSLKP
jgi:hypothetical protein